MNSDDPFRDNADLIRAIEDAPPRGGMKVPERVLFDLEETRGAARRRPTTFFTRHSALLRLAAVLTFFAGLTWLIMPHGIVTAHVTITSPGDEITNTQPIIAWNSKDKPGQKYDVWILPAEGDHLTATALFVATGVTSPVAFSQMQPGKAVASTALQSGTDYRVLVCLADAGRNAGVPIPFKVKPAKAP